MILRRAGASLGCRCSTLDGGTVGNGGDSGQKGSSSGASIVCSSLSLPGWNVSPRWAVLPLLEGKLN